MLQIKPISKNTFRLRHLTSSSFLYLLLKISESLSNLARKHYNVHTHTLQPFLANNKLLLVQQNLLLKCLTSFKSFNLVALHFKATAKDYDQHFETVSEVLSLQKTGTKSNTKSSQFPYHNLKEFLLYDKNDTILCNISTPSSNSALLKVLVRVLGLIHMSSTTGTRRVSSFTLS